MVSKKKKMIIIIVAAVLVVAVAVTAMTLLIPRTGKKIIDVWSVSDEFSVESVKSVEKQPDKDFKILMMTDIQLWFNLGDNAKTFALMDDLVEATKPDLIALPGDNVSGLTTSMLTRNFVAKMESYQIPWAPVFGNHDTTEGNATMEWQSDRFTESEYCLFSRGPSNLDGCGNYPINITENGKIIQTLFFFNNGQYYDYGGEIGNKEVYMGYEQIAWYRWNVEGIAKAAGHTVPSMTFSHFAPPEFRTAIKTLGVKDPDPDSSYYTVPEEYGFGYCNYLPGVAPVNSGFIDMAKELGSTKYVFVGHDHENTASILFEGIRYTYGLKTGCSPRYWNDATEYGGTVITVRGENDVNVEHKVMQTL